MAETEGFGPDGAQVAPPDGWTPERTAELQTLLRGQQEDEKSGPSW